MKILSSIGTVLLWLLAAVTFIRLICIFIDDVILDYGQSSPKPPSRWEP